MNVIVIDDDFDDFTFFKEAITEFDSAYKCVYFDDADTAMETMNSIQTFQPEYIFIDINMPKTGGAECLYALRSHRSFKNVIIVMFSTFMPEFFATEMRDHGANWAFQKPNTMKEYIQILSQIFPKSMKVNKSKVA